MPNAPGPFAPIRGRPESKEPILRLPDDDRADRPVRATGTGTVRSVDPGAATSFLRASVFPAAVVVAVVVLGLSGATGSSLGIYATANGVSEEEAGLVAGPARGIRSDEWLVRTPWVLRQLEHGLPATVAGGAGVHDAAVLLDLPTGGWEVLLRPHTMGYRFLGAEGAFALEWWALFAVQLLGVYVLLLTLTGRVALSALAASLVTLSPATQWWTIPATFTTIGYGCLATALVLLAHRARTARGRLGLAVLAGFALAAFLTALYPPWQIGTALVLVPIGVAPVVPDLRSPTGRRRALGSLAVVLAVTLGLGGTLFGAFMVQHRDSVEAISSTVYPGRRVASAGGATPLPIVLGSAFDSFASEKPFAMVNGTNQSENSSSLPLLLPVAVASLALLAGRRLTGSRSSPALIGALVAGGVIAGWMLLPVPAGVGRFLLLTRVPPSRLLLPLGLVGVIALALLASHQSESASHLDRWRLSAGVAVLGGALVWGAGRYSVDGGGVGLRRAAPFVLVVLLGVALALSRRPLPGFAVLVLFSLWQTSLINPLQLGMEPLTSSPLRKAIDSVRQVAPADAAWIAYSVDATVTGTLTASGVNSLSGVSPYPDRATWQILDPGLDNGDAWNRYAHVSFTVAAPGAATSFTLLGPDNLSVAVDPCAPVLRSLGVRFLVTQGFELGTCVRPLVKVPYGKTYVMVYGYTP